MSGESKKSWGRDQDKISAFPVNRGIEPAEQEDPGRPPSHQEEMVTMLSATALSSSSIPQQAAAPSHPLPAEHQDFTVPSSTPQGNGPYQYPPPPPLYHPYPYPAPGYYPPAAYPPPPTHVVSHPFQPTQYQQNPQEQVSPHYHQEKQQEGTQSTTTSSPPEIFPPVPYYPPHYPAPYYSVPPHYYGVPYPPTYTTSSADATAKGTQDDSAELRTDEGSSSNTLFNSQLLTRRRRSSPKTSKKLDEEEEKLRKEKNNLARKKENDLKARMKIISDKRPEDRNHDENEAFKLFEQRRLRKNKRSRERTREKKAEMNRILAIPEQRRSEEEKIWLDVNLKAKRRKNEGDRMRRERIKQLGQSSSKSSITSSRSQDLSDFEVAYTNPVANKNEASSSEHIPSTISNKTSESTNKNRAETPTQRGGGQQPQRQHGGVVTESSSAESNFQQQQQQQQQQIFRHQQRQQVYQPNTINNADTSVGEQQQQRQRGGTSSTRALSPNILDQLANVMESPIPLGSELANPTLFFTSMSSHQQQQNLVAIGNSQLEVPTLPSSTSRSMSSHQQQHQQQNRQNSDTFGNLSMRTIPTQNRQDQQQGDNLANTRSRAEDQLQQQPHQKQGGKGYK